MKTSTAWSKRRHIKLRKTYRLKLVTRTKWSITYATILRTISRCSMKPWSKGFRSENRLKSSFRSKSQKSLPTFRQALQMRKGRGRNKKKSCSKGCKRSEHRCKTRSAKRGLKEKGQKSRWSTYSSRHAPSWIKSNSKSDKVRIRTHLITSIVHVGFWGFGVLGGFG